VTEGRLASYLASWDALRHRLARLAGDQAALATEQRSVRARLGRGSVPPTTVERWAGETDRIARELASAMEVIDRLADDAADTAVISLDDVAGE
jgi:hypothetical protein